MALCSPRESEMVEISQIGERRHKRHSDRCRNIVGLCSALSHLGLIMPDGYVDLPHNSCLLCR
jgi:hypothetical protein